MLMDFRPSALCAALALALALGACRQAPPPNVAATVNGRAITYDDLEKQYRRQFTDPAEGTSADQIQVQKMELLRAMVDEEIMVQRAEKLSLMATDAEVEAKYNQIRAPYTQEEFQKQLDARKMNTEELKAQLRRSLSVEKLINKEITSRINITDKDIADSYNSNKGSFNYPEPQIRFAQILVTPSPDPNVRNLRQDKAQNEEQARKKIQLIEQRLKAGDDFAMLAQNYSEDPMTAPNGGDHGFIPESAFEKAPPELRKIIMTLPVNQVSPPIRTADGWRVIKIYSREPAGQRELNDPRVQQQIRETLLNRKDQLLKAAYAEAARNESKVMNYFALSIAPGFGKK